MAGRWSWPDGDHGVHLAGTFAAWRDLHHFCISLSCDTARCFRGLVCAVPLGASSAELGVGCAADMCRAAASHNRGLARVHG